NAVQVYHPASDSWSSAANYPNPVTWAACGSIHGKLYCAGGMKSTGAAMVAGYVYDPTSNSWSPIADIPLAGGLGSSAYSAANGLLLMAGGFEGPAVITNQAMAYDPKTDSWLYLPPL